MLCDPAYEILFFLSINIRIIYRIWHTELLLQIVDRQYPFKNRIIIKKVLLYNFEVKKDEDLRT